jgi:hypothetical protein
MAIFRRTYEGIGICGDDKSFVAFVMNFEPGILFFDKNNNFELYIRRNRYVCGQLENKFYQFTGRP